MAAANTDKLKKYKSLFSTTLSTGIGTGTGDTITPASVSGLPTDTAITLTFDRVDSGGVATPTKMERIVGVISGGNFTSYVRGVDGTTEQAHTAGAVIEMIWNADDWNDAVDWGLVQHNQDGTHGAITSTNASMVTASMVTPTINAGKFITSINDANGNEVIKTPATTSAVNEVTITNSATGNAVQVSATGGDTNISLNLVSKGSGTVQVNGVAISTTTDGWTAAGETWTYASASTFTISGVDVTAKYTKGTRLKFTQTTVKYAVVVASSFSTNTTVTIAVNTDYTLANAAITDNYFSYQASPVGYPVAFNVTVTNGLESKISMIGRELTIYGWSYLLQAAGGSTTVEKTITHGFTFASVPIVVAELIGIKYTSAPTTISDLTTTVTGDGLYKNFALSGITTTVFKAHSGQTGNSGADTYRGFSWMVKGVL